MSALLATVLSDGRWKWHAVACTAGTAAGLCVGFSIWWPSDPIAGPLVPIDVALGTVLAALVATVAGVLGRYVPLSAVINRRVAWAVFGICLAFGPAALALTPSLVAHRMSRNDRLATERFKSLQEAVQKVYADPRERVNLCDGSSLRRRYSGPPFSLEDWQRITENSVKQDGYFFMVYCREESGYIIIAQPARYRGDGTRHFCTDQSGYIGCGTNDRSPRACMPCPR